LVLEFELVIVMFFLFGVGGWLLIWLGDMMLIGMLLLVLLWVGCFLVLFVVMSCCLVWRWSVS